MCQWAAEQFPHRAGVDEPRSSGPAPWRHSPVKSSSARVASVPANTELPQGFRASRSAGAPPVAVWTLPPRARSCQLASQRVRRRGSTGHPRAASLSQVEGDQAAAASRPGVRSTRINGRQEAAHDW